MKRTKGFLLLVMMLLGLFCLSGPSWAEAACPEGEPQQSYTGSLLITAKEGDADSQSGLTLPVVETRGFSVLRGLPSGTDIVL